MTLMHPWKQRQARATEELEDICEGKPNPSYFSLIQIFDE